MNTYALYNSYFASKLDLVNSVSQYPEKIDFNIKKTNKSPIKSDFEWYKRFYKNKKPWLSYALNGSDYGIRFHSLADFRITSKKKEIVFYKRKTTDTQTLRHLLVDQVIPLALSLNNKTLFHSSTVEIGNKAVSFMAPSGSGKSTLAAYFSTRNHKILTDDTLLIEERDKRIVAYPSYPGIRLWPDNINKIFKNGMRSKKVSQYNTKRLIDKNIKFVIGHGNPLGLRSIYFINVSDHTGVEPLSPTEAFSLIIRSIFRLDFRNRNINIFQFEFINKILNNVELYKLNYEKKYESLEKVYSLVTNNNSK